MNKLFFVAGFLSVGLACSMAANAAQNPKSLVVCRGQQCADVKYTMTKEYLYNQLVELFDKNVSKELLLCEADPVSRRCLEPGIRVQASSNLVNTDIVIPSAEIVDVKPLKNQTAMETILDFKVKANDTNPKCQSALAQINVNSTDDVTLMMRGFDCSFTATGNSTLNMVHTLDYVDFDYGTLGAYYTLGSGQAVRGGKSGYTLLRFTEKLPGTTFTLSDTNSEQGQAAVQVQQAQLQQNQAVVEKKVAVDIKDGTMTVKETEEVIKPLPGTDLKQTQSSVTTTVTKEIDGVNAKIKEEVDTGQSVTKTRTAAAAVAAAEIAAAPVQTQVQEVVIAPAPAPAPTVVVEEQPASMDASNSKTTVKRSYSETQEGDWTITRETVETTSSSTMAEPDEGFWSRFADKAVKVIYLENPFSDD